jgi:RimJ/RimL family protein N-acetyltransferase
MAHQPTLVTKRLILRPFELSDAKAVQRLAGDRAIADTTLNIPHPYDDGAAEEWISTHKPKFASHELANFAITRRTNGELLGAVGLAMVPQFQRAELGYWMGKQYWNRGYCTEASMAVVEYAFTRLGVNRVYAVHFKRNPASGQVMKKLGMKREGVLRQHAKKWDSYEDMVFYGLLRKDWLKRRGDQG